MGLGRRYHLSLRRCHVDCSGETMVVIAPWFDMLTERDIGNSGLAWPGPSIAVSQVSGPEHEVSSWASQFFEGLSVAGEYRRQRRLWRRLRLRWRGGVGGSSRSGETP